MASWITHLRIADEVLQQSPELDRMGFCLGNIAPDCNMENEDWTAFVPSRETTHWMTGANKLSADDEAFRKRYLSNPDSLCNQERSFYQGYMAHLITDVAFYRWIHSDTLTAVRCQRISAVPELQKLLEGQPESYESLKRALGKKRLYAGLLSMESEYLHSHPESSYLTVLPNAHGFPDYLDYLPKGGIERKIRVMGGIPAPCSGEIDQLFITRDELNTFVADTCTAIVNKLRS